MSKVAIQGNASGSGVLTIAAPNTNSNFTLDIPSASGVIDRLNRAGNVLQVVSTAVTSTASVSGTTFQDIGLSASITPTSASSKILVLLSITLSGSDNAYAAVNLVRGATDIIKGDAGSPGIECTFGLTNAGNGNSFWTFGSQPSAFNYLDSPATTSSTTYKVQIRPQISGSLTVYMNRSNTLGDDNQFRTASTITLMEIAA